MEKQPHAEAVMGMGTQGTDRDAEGRQQRATGEGRTSPLVYFQTWRSRKKRSEGRSAAPMSPSPPRVRDEKPAGYVSVAVTGGLR